MVIFICLYRILEAFVVDLKQAYSSGNPLYLPLGKGED